MGYKQNDDDDVEKVSLPKFLVFYKTSFINSSNIVLKLFLHSIRSRFIETD